MSDCEQISKIAQDKWATVSKSIRSLMKNERPWAKSLRSLMAKEQQNSRQKGNHEQIAQVAHGNRVTVSGLLMSLMKKERMSKSLVFLNESLIRSFAHKNKWFPKKIWIKSYFTFLKFFFKLKKIEGFAHSLLFKERYERIAQFAPNERATVSESLRLLSKNEQPWVIRSGGSPKMSDCERIAQVAHQKWANERIAHSLIFSQKKELLAEKTNEQIPNPGFIP